MLITTGQVCPIKRAFLMPVPKLVKMGVYPRVYVAMAYTSLQ